MKNRAFTGFTMIELVVVLAIISLLLILTANAVRYGVTLSNDQQLKNDVIQVQQVLTQYYAEKGFYPFSSCPAGNGFDQMDSLQNVYNFVTSGFYASTDNALKTAFTNTFNSINAAKQPLFGYCSSNQLASGGASAYVLAVETTGSQICSDSGNRNYFIVGLGTYSYNLQNRYYYQIPQDFGLTSITQGNYQNLTCYKV